MNTEETSLQTIENYGILRKIVYFFKRVIAKNDNNMYFSDCIIEDTEERTNFKKSLKFTQDPEERMLLELQKKIEKYGINEQNVYYLTKNLNEVQRKKLLDLYKKQIKSLNIDIRDYQNKILKIRKRINK